MNEHDLIAKAHRLRSDLTEIENQICDLMIAKTGLKLGDLVEYGPLSQRKKGRVISFRKQFDSYEQTPIVAPLLKDGSTHSRTRDTWPDNVKQIEELK